MAPIASPASTASTASPFRKHHQYRPQDLVIASDTDSASSDDGSVLASPFPSRASSRTAYRPLERAEAFTSGASAVLQVAGHLSESVFVYPLLNAAPQDHASLHARVTTLEIRQGAADAVRGALSVGSTASALVPSQTLPLFLPNLFAIAQQQQPAVFHVACEAIRPDLSVGSSYESVYALQHAGALLLNASTPQELHDLAVVAHVAALRLRKLLVHFYDGARVAKELTKLQLLTPAALQALAAVEKTEKTEAAAHGTDVALQVQHVMDDLFPVLQRQYNVYEYYGAPDATAVVVVLGEAAEAVRQAVAYEQMLGHAVGVLQVRLLLPWSHALFAQALPSSVQRVAVLENVSAGAFAFQQGLLTQNVQVFFHSAHWPAPAPLVATGIYGGVFRTFGFSVGMARAVLRHAQRASPSRRSFVVAKSEALFDAALELATVAPQLDVLYGAAWELDHGLDGYTKQYLFWGVESPAGASPSPSLAGSYATTLALLNRNPTTQVHALVTHSAATPAAPQSVATLEVRVSLAGQDAGLQQGVQQADVAVVTDAALLADLDVAASVKPRGALLVHAAWKTLDDIDASPRFKQQLAQQHATLLVVDLAELAAHVGDPAIAAVAPQVAFLKAAGLFDERVVFALLAARFDASQHATLRSFVAAVWGDVNSIVYPHSEWAGAVEAAAEAAPLRALATLAPSKLPQSAAAIVSKRGRHAVSLDTQTAWKFTFPSHFAATQAVRDHVTDVVRVTKWERLTPAAYSRNVFHVEFDIAHTKISYNIGEALAVFAHNQRDEVLRFLRSYDVAPDALVTLPVNAKSVKGVAPVPTEETLTFFQLFSQVLDVFGRPSKKFYQALADLATDETEKRVLSTLVDTEGQEDLKARVEETLTYADLLAEFPSAKPPMSQLLKLIPRIKPRHYSIASSMKMNPTSVHLLIVVHDWTTPAGRYRVGQATDFLKDVRPGQELSVSVCSSVMKLPVNPSDPIIMAGLGTGMAPFRAFIQERAFLKAQGVAVGPVALYFGARSKEQEFLYGAELEQYEKEGLLTHLRCAFSRDQAHKIYIQDRIAEDQGILGDWLLNRNAHFYLCGPTWPVADVREALLGAIMAEGGGDRKQANAYIERMREHGRYVLEVY